MAINMDIIGTYQTKCSWVNHLSVFACVCYECVSVLRIIKQSQISWKPIQVCSCRTWSYNQNECSGQEIPSTVILSPKPAPICVKISPCLSLLNDNLG